MQRSNEQKLIDIMFEIAITMHMNPEVFQKMTRDQVGEWVASNLRGCGFDTVPMGASWGVLKAR